MESGYVIMRDGLFLQVPPQNGWTRDLRRALRFSSYAKARHEAAENEYPVSLEDILQPSE